MANRLRNFLNMKKIKKDIMSMHEGESKIISYINEDKLELSSQAGFYYRYDFKNDSLKMLNVDKDIPLEGIEKEVKKLLKEKIIRPLKELKNDEQQEIESQQQAVYINIKSNLNKPNYTFEHHFDVINRWKQESFENFINKFSESEMVKLKQSLSESAKYYDQLSIAGGRINKKYDNLSTSHVKMLNKIKLAELNKPEEPKNNKVKLSNI